MAVIDRRTAKDGTISYRVRVRKKGYIPQIASFPTLQAAKKWGTMIEGQMIEGRHFPTNEAKKHTLGDLLLRYEQEVMSQKKWSTTATQQYRLRYWLMALGHMRLADIQPVHIIT